MAGRPWGSAEAPVRGGSGPLHRGRAIAYRSPPFDKRQSHLAFACLHTPRCRRRAAFAELAGNRLPLLQMSSCSGRRSTAAAAVDLEVGA